MDIHDIDKEKAKTVFWWTNI